MGATGRLFAASAGVVMSAAIALGAVVGCGGDDEEDRTCPDGSAPPCEVAGTGGSAGGGGGGTANGGSGGEEECFGTCENITAGEPNFTDTASCLEYMETVDPRGEDVDGDLIPDGDDDPTNDGLDDWGRPIRDAEGECGCTTCLEESLACQDNLGCREIATCALNKRCRTIRECFYGEGWPGPAPCAAVINKWGAQSVSSALGEEISRCLIREGCPARACPCADGDPNCDPTATCPIVF